MKNEIFMFAPLEPAKNIITAKGCYYNSLFTFHFSLFIFHFLVGFQPILPDTHAYFDRHRKVW